MAGNYSVTVTDQFNCKRDSTFSLNQPSIFKDSVVIDSAVCFGTATGKARVFITGNNPPYTYLWNEGTTTDSITEKNSGVYTLTTFDFKGCTKKQDVFIPQRDLFEAIITTYTDVRCFGDTNGTAIATVTGGKLPINIFGIMEIQPLLPSN
ncbi:MAG: SprB repeat-containing protein [Bacteroidetes bacterium]|nr:SprB repeat-containing protein [Bacteroidota bacterium]